MAEKTYSRYQLAVFDEVKLGHRGKNVAINAVAGSGKTTTCTDSLAHIPNVYSVQFNAFGKDIASELRTRVTRPNTRISTYNAFGWDIALKNSTFKPQGPNADKTIQTLQHIVLGATEQDEESWKRYQAFKSPVNRLVSMLKGQLAYTVEQAAGMLQELISHHNIETPEASNFPQVVLDTYKHVIENTTVYDWDDQVFMPLKLNMLIPRSDFVFVDEFQDTNDMQAELMKRACKGGRLIAVGDPDQAIYGFRGATPDAFGRFVKEFDARELPLSICYRCPKAVVKEAQTIVPRIEYAPWAREGAVGHLSTDDFKRRVVPGDFVLCRTIAPLIKRCLELIRNGVPARVLGRNVGEDLLYLIDKISGRSYFLRIQDFRDLLGAYYQRKMQSYQALQLHSLAMSLADKHETLMALMVDCQSVSDIIQKLTMIFVDKGDNCVMFMSIHKAKGLECTNPVWILRPDLLPHPRAKDVPWMLEEERRLHYVAITRAKSELFYVQKERDDK